MPGTKPEMVVVTPDPVIPPGLIVQFPEGKPINVILPVSTVHEGCLIDDMTGIAGVPALAFTTIFAEGTEVHPTEFVTVNA